MTPDPAVSIIITTRNEEANIANCLTSIAEQAYPDSKIEVLVIDNNSEDRTKELARRFTDKVFNCGPERSTQRNFGIRQASGKYILYLDADMVLSRDILAKCVNRCESASIIALYIPERIIGGGFWISVRDFERGFYDGTAVDCVRFVRRDKILEIGGFDEGLTGPEDWDFDRRIRALGKAGMIDSPIYHNEARFTYARYLAKKAYYARSFDKYIQKWGEGDSLVKKQLGFWYRFFGVFIENGKWKRLLAHPLLSAGLYILRFSVGARYILDRKKSLPPTKGILLICPFFRPNIGGVETRLDDMCDELDKRGFTVTVLTYQPIVTRAKGLSVERKGNVTIYRFWWLGFDLFHKLKPYPVLQMLYLCPVLFVGSFIFLLANSSRIAVIHTAGFGASLIGRILKAVFKKRWIVSTHAIYDLKREGLIARFLKWLLIRADFILTLSEPSRQELIGIGLDANSIANQITWVNQDIFRPLDRGLSKGRIKHENKFIVLFVGRLLEIKGVRTLISVAEETPFMDYIFIGDGPMGPFIKDKAAGLSNVKFLGGIENRELPVYYNAADAFIMPSQYKEGLGRVAVEALSCGAAVICSNMGGMAQILDDSVAVLIRPTMGCIKAAILDLYNHPGKSAELRKNAAAFARRVFSPNNVETIISAYGLGS